MGLFISTINEQGSIKSNPNKCWSESLQKIKQYHGMFKYVCDCFVINTQQFKQIFGSLEKAKTWDPRSQGKVDALQIFCGLIIFAREASFKSKLSFLFSIFDFNQIKSLSFIDVQVIILNVCNSVYKILNKNGKVNETQIADWLGNYFHKRQRIKITRLYKFCLQNQDIQAFFKCINNNIDENLQFPFTLPNILSETQILPRSKVRKQAKSKINAWDFSQKYKQQTLSNMEWHKDLINKIVKVQELQYKNGQENKGQESSYGCKITWVYGINMEGQSKPFITLKKLDNCIVYKASSMAIIHDLQLSNQHIIEGHLQQLSCIAYNHKQQILATVQNQKFPNINLWKRQEQGKKIRKNQKFIKYAIIPTNHSNGIQLMEFVARQSLLATVGAREKNNPILIYDFSRLEVTHQIIMQQSISMLFNPLLLLDRTQLNTIIFDTFFVCSQNNTIHQICLKNNGIASNFEKKQHSYQQLQKANNILSAVGCFININNPYLRSYKDKSISITIITGHQSGSVCKITPYPKFNQQQIISGLDGPVQCLQVTNSILAVGAGSYIYVYDLDVLVNKGGLLMTANLKDQDHIDFLSYGIRYFDFIKDYILGVTQAGQFIRIETKIQLNRKKQQQKARIQLMDSNNYIQRSNCGAQQLKISLMTKMIKFEGSNIFCILNWKQGNQIILFATKGNKVLGIDSLTHQIEDVWQISSVQTIVALDAVSSDQGVCYIICACKSGRLYIRVNWEQSPKYYDCGSQIVDAKISKDCSYLLVATRSNYLLFFAQVNKNFTSPRKLLFEYETPCSINFLDNFKFFLVITSAKNAYIIEIPQLKHKKLNKQTQKISISKVNVKFPYSNGCLGGSMRFSLLSLKERDIYFFNSHNALQRGNYTVLNTHKCPVSQIAVNQHQSKFYSLGKSDNTLIEWSIFQSKYKTKKGTVYFDRQHQILGIKQSTSQFEDIYEFAINKSPSTQCQSQLLKGRNKSETYFFKGTKLQKLNQAIQKYYKSYIYAARRKHKLNSINRQYTQNDEIQLLCENNEKEQEENQLQFKKRPPGVSLIAQEVYGFETLHKQSLTYANNGQQIMGYASRFIIRMNIKNKKQIIYEPTSKKISFMIRNQLDNEILYCLVQQNPMIYMLYRQPLRTTHHRGIIHLSLYKNYVLSYGIAQNSGFSINLHNYLTGQLLHISYTDIKVCQFILVNEKLAVSFNQVRVWESFYPSDFIITASAGCLLPNKKDILLGLYDGRFAILSDRGIFHLHSQIHQKAHDNVIDIIQIKPQKNNENSYQIVSVGRDQKIKIWTSCFQIKMMIPFRHKNNLTFIGQNNKVVLNSENVRVKSMDVFDNKILLVMHTGHIVQVQLETVKKIQSKLNNDQTNRIQNQTTVNIQTISDKSFSYASVSNQDEDSIVNQRKMNQLSYKWTNIYQIHSVRNKKCSNRRTFFSIHPHHPILASSACDYQLIIRNYQTNQVVCKLYYQRQKVQCIKFSPKGNLLTVGFDNGNIQFYKLKIIKDQTQKIQNVILQSSQIFKQAQSKIFVTKVANLHNMNNNMNMTMSMSMNNNSNLLEQESQKPTFSIINMQYSECSTYFAVSCVIEVQKKSQSFIILYRQSSSLSVGNQNNLLKNNKFVRNGINQSQTPCYTQADIIQITSSSQQTLNTNNSKYTKSAYFIQFLSQATQSKAHAYPQQASTKNITKSFINLNNNKKQQLKIRNQKSQVFLILFQQYLDANKIRINSDNKVKIKTYQIQDKALYRQDCNINFLKIKFPHFVYARLFNNNDHCFNIQTGFTPSLTKYNSIDDYYNPHSMYQNKNDQKQDMQVTISQMLTLGENVFYGDTSGNLHIVKLNSLLINNQSNRTSSEQLTKSKSHQPQPSINSLNNPKPSLSSLHKPQRSNMNLSKTYSSHISFINQIQTSTDYEYLFVSGGIDDVIVKYRLVHQNRNMDLDNVSYPMSYQDHHREYIHNEKLYEFLNDVDPIRDQISDVLLDVEQESINGKALKNTGLKGTKLQLIRIYGRRAFDKRNNLFEDKQGNLIYYIGPNIIIQDPYDPAKQKHIPVDPNPYTKSPHIGYITMNDKFLIAATQQQNSRIFVWDIYSNTCLSEMKLKNFSIIYHMAQSSSQKVILVYGINNLLEPSMQLIDWSQRQVTGNVNMMYSGRWKIKDICEISQKQDGLQFVSCGMQHLMYWQYIADTLVYSSFGLDNPQLTNRTFLTVRFVEGLIITGCQIGIIYIFKNFQLVASLKVHQCAIRTLCIENQLIFSGGMDGMIFGTTINVDQMQKYSLRVVQQHKIKIKIPKQKRRSSQISGTSIKPHKKTLISQINQQNQQQLKQLLLIEQDVQSIVLVRNDKYRNRSGLINKVFVGTRSGNIFLLTRSFNFQTNSKNKNNNINSINNANNQSNKTISRKNSGIFTGQRFANSNGQIQPIIWAHDHDSIASVCFDQQRNDLFYLITKSGVLQIWSLKSFKKVYSYNISQDANKVFCFKEYIIISCERKILTVKVDIINNSIHYIKQMSKKYDGIIRQSCLSKSCTMSNCQGTANKEESSQRQSNINSKSSFTETNNKGAYLVIGLKKNQFNQIIINRIQNQIIQKFVVVNLKYEIQFMDFSRNCKYLLFKDIFEEMGMVNLQNFKRINTIFVQMGIQWESEGVRISPHGQRIYCSYSRQNKITVLRRINDKEIIIGDQMGTLRTFQYPCPEQKIGQLHMQCYTTHMNFIKCIQIHPTEPYVITTSVYDRSLILWKLVKN